MNGWTGRFRQALLVFLLAGPAYADGEFLQLDIGRENQGAVASMVRGPLSFGLNYTDYDSGRIASLNVKYALPLNSPFTVRIGPSVAYQRDDGDQSRVRAGLGLVVERYSPTPFGSTFLLADLNTINQSWFVLGQVTFAPSNFGLELSRGGSNTYHETTLALQKRLTDSPVSLRLGYRFSSREAFAGFSVNTF